jgi:hypothetical protein
MHIGEDESSLLNLLTHMLICSRNILTDKSEIMLGQLPRISLNIVKLTVLAGIKSVIPAGLSFSSSPVLPALGLC